MRRDKHRSAVILQVFVVFVAALPWFFIADSRGSGIPGWLEEHLPPLVERLTDRLDGYFDHRLLPTRQGEANKTIISPQHMSPTTAALPYRCPDLNKISPLQATLFNNEYLTVTSEIQRRLEQDYLLFGVKLGATGAVLGLILTVYSMIGMPRGNATSPVRKVITSEASALCCWAAVCISAIIDIRSQYGIRVIIDLGDWIRTYVDPCLSFDSHTKGWEHYWLERGLPHTQPASMLWGIERRLLTLFLYGVSVFVFVWRPLHAQDDDGENLKIMTLSALFVPTSVALIGTSQFYSTYEGDVIYWIAGYILALSIVSISLMVYIRRYKIRRMT